MSTGFLGVPDLDELIPGGPFQRPPEPWHQEPASPSPAGARVGATTANCAMCSVRHSRRLSTSHRLKIPREDLRCDGCLKL